MSSDFGILHIVATPIGNLSDMTKRAVDVLQAVDRVYAEDTRTSSHLLQSLGIQANLVSLHEHNEAERVEQVMAYLKEGHSAALISDAGTPLISDPGYKLVAACHDAEIPVSPIPGASACIAALSVSGLPTDSFLFVGFLPPKRESRCNKLKGLLQMPHTMVFYESKHRIIATLEDMASVFGADRQVALCRELTKRFETVRKSELGKITAWVIENANQQKGEYVLVVRGVQHTADGEGQVRDLLSKLLPDLSVKRASTIVADLTGEKKNAIYKIALQMQSDR